MADMKVQSAGIETGNKAHGHMSPSSKQAPPIKDNHKKPMSTKLRSRMMARSRRTLDGGPAGHGSGSAKENSYLS